MRNSYLLCMIAPLLFLSCKKEKVDPAPPQPIPPVLLKDVVIPNLPSPYYHFEYDAMGKADFVSYASGLLMYDITYSGNRIIAMQNNNVVNKDRLEYFYDNTGRVNEIRYADSTGILFKRASFSYNGQSLVKIVRERKSVTSMGIEKTSTFTYYGDGNLRQLSEHRPANPASGQAEATYTDTFEQYDNKINADAFMLVHNEFFEHLVLLPSVRLQKNNPGKIIRSGDGVNYEIDYTYTYNNKNEPLSKTGQGEFTSGPNAGQTFPSAAVFSYY